MNTLRELMDFANKNNMFGQGWNSPQSSYDPSGRRAQWAAEMMSRQQSQAPNFAPGMGDDDMSAPNLQYVRPRSMRDLNAEPMNREQPGMMQNFLRTLFQERPYGAGVRTGMGGVRG